MSLGLENMWECLHDPPDSKNLPKSLFFHDKSSKIIDFSRFSSSELTWRSRHAYHGPTEEPTVLRTELPTEQPSRHPTEQLTQQPSMYPNEQPSRYPTDQPTKFPTEEPTRFPTEEPTRFPTELPSRNPTEQPTNFPTEQPTRYPTEQPSRGPTEPTSFPTEEPTWFPTLISFPTLRELSLNTVSQEWTQLKHGEFRHVPWCTKSICHFPHRQ